jgi:CRP-like cAMP-binding protein
MKIVEILRSCELCNGLTDTEIESLAALFHTQHARPNEVLLKEGEKSNQLYIVSRGRVAVLVYSSISPGEREKIATLHDYDIYGEFALMDGFARSASIVAEEDSDLIYAEYLDFHRFLEKNEHIGFVVMRNLAKILTAKLRKTNLEIRNGTHFNISE